MMASDSARTANSEHTWFVDSGASHHMTSHQEWFRDLRTSKWFSIVPSSSLIDVLVSTNITDYIVSLGAELI